MRCDTETFNGVLALAVVTFAVHTIGFPLLCYVLLLRGSRSVSFLVKPLRRGGRAAETVGTGAAL